MLRLGRLEASFAMAVMGAPDIGRVAEIDRGDRAQDEWSFSSDIVTQLAADIDQRLWFGTQRGYALVAALLVLAVGVALWRTSLVTKRNRSLTAQLSERQRAQRDTDARLEALKTQVASFQETQDNLATLGRYTAGIAHDLNHVFSIVNLNADRLLKTGGLDKNGSRLASQIVDQTDQASRLLRQVLDYSRQSNAEHRMFDLGDLMLQLQPTFADLVPADIDLTYRDFDGRDYWVHGNADQIQQVVTNLIVNATDSGAKNIALEISEGGAGYSGGEAVPGATRFSEPFAHHVALAVHDDGGGVPEVLKGHIFEAFFTTKGVGQGTGLGLAQVEGLVRQHGGAVEVESEIGRGTSMTIYLPKPDIVLIDAGEPEPRPQQVVGSGQTVLVAEDNVSLLRLFAEILTEGGYTVLTATSGAEAFSLVEQFGDQVQLILSDLMMSNMSGTQLIKALHANGNAIPVILLTGLQDSDAETRGMALGDLGLVGMLRKPVTAEDLLAAVADGLNSEGVNLP